MAVLSEQSSRQSLETPPGRAGPVGLQPADMVPWASTSSEARSPLRQGMDARDTPGTAPRGPAARGRARGSFARESEPAIGFDFPDNAPITGESTSQHGSCSVVEDDAEGIAVT